MSEGEEAYRLPAKWDVFVPAETAVFRFPLVDFVLPAGEHVLAISLHNTETSSSDLRIGAITLVEVASTVQAATEDRPLPAAPAKTREIEFLEDVLSTTLLINDEDHQYSLDAKAKLAAAHRANGDEAGAAKLEGEIAASKQRIAAPDLSGKTPEK
jgi:hypothetical protein